MRLKVSVFNVENLFHRARAINKDNNISAAILGDIEKLQVELDKAVYDKPKILRLYKKVQSVIDISEDRGKLFRAKFRSTWRVVANGKADWDGAIVFRRDKFTKATRGNTARVINDIDADIQGIVEAEDRIVLQQFNSHLLNRRFDYNMLIDGNDRRGIDVGLYSKYPITNIKSHIFDEVGGKKVFSRDCPEFEISLPNGEKVYVLINHLKSKGFGDPANNDRRRKSQAEQIKNILANYDLSRDMVIVMGDLNDTPGSNPLSPLLNINNLHDVLELEYGGNMNKRWTYYFNSHNQIDYVLVSKPLENAFSKAGVLRRGMPDIERRTLNNEKKYPTVTHKSNAASDHGAVWAEFNI